MRFPAYVLQRARLGGGGGGGGGGGLPASSRWGGRKEVPLQHGKARLPRHRGKAHAGLEAPSRVLIICIMLWF